MAQQDNPGRERATYIAEETAFGVVPSGSFPNALTRISAIGDDLIVGDLQQEMLEVMDERVRRFDAIQPVHGLKIASKAGGLKCLLKATPSTAQLTDAGTAASLSPRIMLRHVFGTEYADAGSTVDSAASATVISPTDPGQFKKGTWIAIEINGEMEATKILNIAAGALTVSPALSGTPSSGDIIRNLYSYAPGERYDYVSGENNARSLCIRQRFGGESDESTTHTLSGCFGDMTWDLPEWGKLPSMTLGVTATNYTFGATSPAASVATGTDEMGASFAWTPSVYLVSGNNPIVRATTLPCEGASVAFTDTVEMVRDPSAVQTIHSIVRTGGRPSSVKMGLKLRFDAGYDMAFAADTDYKFALIQRVGTGTTASFWILEVPRARLAAQPKRVLVGTRLHLELAFNGFQDGAVTLASETGEDLDLIKAPMRVAFG